MRVLSNDDIEQVLTLDDCLEALETAYKEYTERLAANRPRTFTYFPIEDSDHPGFRYRMKSQEGGNVSSGVWALRVVSDMAGVETLPSGHTRRRLLPVAPGGRYVGLVTLFSLKTLEPLAIMHDSIVQKLRVGATSALGVRELARPESTTAGLFGSGWQADAHLEFLLHVHPSIEEVRVFSPTPDHREQFAARWAARADRKIVAVDEPHGAVDGCDIVICATATMDPCFDGRRAEPGSHVTAITNPDGTVDRRELDDAMFDRADLIVVLARQQLEHDNQRDILGPVDRGTKQLEDIVELGELLVGKATGRTSPEDVTIFANNTGMGLQFAAVCARVLELAEEQDLGHVVPTEWFLEDTTP